MTEMLGNHYFYSGEYTKALIELKESLINNPDNISVRKKLIICHVALNEIISAWELFRYSAIQDLSEMITKEQIIDDCPCVVLITKLEECSKLMPEKERLLALAILWFFCSVENSIKYFDTINQSDSTYAGIEATLIKVKTVQQLSF